MRIASNNTRVSVAPGELLRLEDAYGVEFQVQSGALWLTIDGETVDLVLDTRESHVVTQHGRAIVQALGQEPLSVAIIDRKRLAQRATPSESRAVRSPVQAAEPMPA